MPIARRVRGKLASTQDPEYEDRLKRAVEGVIDGSYKTISQAAKANKVSKLSVYTGTTAS